MELLLGDCLEQLPSLPSHSIDLILVDPPHARTQCSWDLLIDQEPLWKECERVLCYDGTVVVLATQPFTSHLICSNRGWYRYCWVWEKSKASGWLNAKRRPLPAHEDIVVFSPGMPRYYPQMRKGLPYNKGLAKKQSANDVYGKHDQVIVKSEDGSRYPRSVLYFKTAESEGKVYHKSQKPIALLSYLIETYTQPGETVLDYAMGSGSAGVACLKTGREFIGIEKDPAIFQIAEQRIAEVRR